MLGACVINDKTTKASLLAPLLENDERQDYVRAINFINEDGRKVVKAFDRQDSSMMKLLAHANCLIVRPSPRP